METIVPQRATPARPDVPREVTLIAVLLAQAALFVFLETMVTLVEKNPLIVPVAVLLVGDVVLAGVLLAARARWLPLVVAAFLLLRMLGTVPYDLPAVIHPVSVVKAVFGVLSLIVPLIGLVIGVTHSRTAGRPVVTA